MSGKFQTTLLALLVVLSGCAAQDRATYWDRYTSLHLAAGKLRTETAPPDAPFDADDLARNFQSIAFGQEKDPFATGDATKRLDSERTMIRWVNPIVYNVLATGPDQRIVLGLVARYFARLTRITGHPARRGKSKRQRAEDDPIPRVLILVADDAVIETFLHEAREEAPKKDGNSRLAHDAIAGFLTTWHRSGVSPCAVYMLTDFDDEGRHTEIVAAFVVIRAGLPDVLRQTCIEEELAQAMGLPNDDPNVRPTLFNDDQEFALLTEHDALLLRILYDPRLAPGMSEDDAMPVVRRIARELLPEG